MRTSQDKHRARMKARRLRQLARQPGFTAMPNRRINAAFDATLLLVAIDRPHLDAVEQREEALRRVAAQLPKKQPSQVAAIHRLIAKGSRSDDPTYRKAGYCDRPRVAFQEAAQ